MSDKEKELQTKIGKKAYLELWKKEMDEFLEGLRKKNGTTDY